MKFAEITGAPDTVRSCEVRLLLRFAAKAPHKKVRRLKTERINHPMLGGFALFHLLKLKFGSINVLKKTKDDVTVKKNN